MRVFQFSLPRLCMDRSVVDGYRSQDPPHNPQKRFFSFLYVCLGSGTILFFCILWCKSCANSGVSRLENFVSIPSALLLYHINDSKRRVFSSLAV